MTAAASASAPAVRRRLGLLAAALALALGGLSAGSTAFAAEPPPIPRITITSPANGVTTNDRTPVFSGTTEEPFPPVTVKVYEASDIALIDPVATLPDVEPSGDAWQTPASEPLPDGAYIAVATQPFELGHIEAQVHFTVDTTPPRPTVTSPQSGSTTAGATEPVAGTAGLAPGDSKTVTVRLFSTPAGAAPVSVESLVLEISPEGTWSGTFGGLSPGAYAVRAEQRDKAGNVGSSGPVAFTMTAPPPPAVPAPPSASFSWFPAIPQAGESISFIATAADPASSITSYAWAVGSGAYQAGGPVLTTSFPAAGPEVIHLHVTSADGQSSDVTRTVTIAPAPLTLMLPFPVVRIAGSETRAGVRITLLEAFAPVGTVVSVTCHGHGCPQAVQSSIAAARWHGKPVLSGSVGIIFRRFERAMRAGVVLEVRVAAPGEIGKYTRFVIRRHRVPVRSDSCLAALEPAPVTCSG